MATQAHTTSRRSFLAAAAVAGAIVAPSVALADAQPALDAELIELGRKLSKLTQEYYVEVARLRPLWNEHHDLMEAWKAEHPHPTGEEATAAYDRLRVECGLAEQEKRNHPDDVMDRISPVSQAILNIPARTWAGVLVKAQLAKFGADQYWECSADDLEWDEVLMRNLCDAVIGMSARTAMAVAAA